MNTQKSDASKLLRRFFSIAHRPTLSVLFVLLAGCSLPQAPGRLEWDTKITAPFGVSTYRLLDLVDSDSTIDEQGWGIGLGEDSVLFFTARGDLDAGFEDSLHLDPFSYTITKFIDAIFLPIERTQERSPHLTTLNPDVAAHHGELIFLDPYPIRDQQTFEMPAGVDSFRVDTGHVWIHITNGVDQLTNLVIRLNNRRGEEFELISGVSLGLNDSMYIPLPLNGLNLNAQNDLTLTATAAGGNMQVDSTRGISWSLAWHTLQCEPYYGIVFPQALREDSTFNLDQQHRLYNGTVKRGALELIASNATQFDDTIVVKFPDVVEPDGDTLVIVEFVPAHEDRAVSIDLTDYRLRLYNEFPQRIRAEMHSVSVLTTDHRAYVNHFEIVSGLFTVNDLILKYFDGELNGLQTDIPYEEVAIERPPKGWDAVHPTTVDLALRVQASVAAYADITLYLASFVGSQRIDTVTLSLRDVYFGADSTIWIHDLARLVDDYPDRITYEGNGVINGFIATSDTSHVRATIELVAPLRFRMDTVNAPGDVQRIDIEPIEDIENATAHIKIWNRLPLGGETQLLLARDSLALIPGSHQPVDTAFTIVIPVPPLENGRAASTLLSEFDVPLSVAVINLLRARPFFARVAIILPGAGEQEFIAHASDFVQVQVVGEIIYRINSEDGP